MIEVLRKIADWNPVIGAPIDYERLVKYTRTIFFDDINKSDWEKIQYLYVRDETMCISSRSEEIERLDGCFLSEDGTWFLLCGEERSKLLDAIYQCGPNLAVLSAWDCDVEEIDVSRLINLQVLDVARCRHLERLLGIESLKEIKRLNLGGTKVDPIPDFSTMEQLQELSLWDVQHEQIDGFKNLRSLRELTLSGSKIREIPSSIRGIKTLRYLDLSELHLDALPEWLPELGLDFTKRIFQKGIVLTDTLVKNVDMSIFDGKHSQEDILKWFEARKKQGETPLNEIKVVFLGNGDVGKSHTIARLLRDGKKPGKAFTGKSTPGIAISDKTYPVNGQDIRVHFWDFGGQDILYSMHRMFLTERTIYVILVDARNETRGSQAREWLDTIRSFAGDASVLLAVNKMDENPSATLDERGLMEEYPNLKKIIKMSALNANTEEFNRLFTNAMLELIRDSEWPKKKWPKNWKRVKDALQTMEDPYIRSREYQRICRECDVDAGSDSLLNWCNDLGVCFCRQDERLRDYVILRPEWITNAIYTILFNKRDKVRNGLISLRDIYALLTTEESRRVLKDIPYSWQDMIYVLDVVRKFHMSYDVDRDTEFFPMLCSENSSAVVQEYATAEDTLEFHMEFDYLPNNVLHRLMVERYLELDSENVWLTGVRFRQRDTGLSAVVKIDEDRLKLYVRSDNPLHGANTYLSVIAGSVERICHDLKLPKPKSWLIYKVGGKQHPFDYEELLQMMEDGEETTYAASLDRVYRKPRIMDVLRQVAPAESAEQERLVADLVGLCADLQATKLYWGTSEDVRNTFLSTVLRRMPYTVLDQTRRGVSETRDSDGELELDIRKYKDIPWTVCEALRVEGVNKVKWNGHLDKLLDNYNPNGLPFLVLLTYVDDVNDRFDAIWAGFQTHIQTYNSGAFQVDKDSFKLYTTEDWAQKHYIKTARCQYIRGDYKPTVYHIFVRMGR